MRCARTCVCSRVNTRKYTLSRAARRAAPPWCAGRLGRRETQWRARPGRQASMATQINIL